MKLKTLLLVLAGVGVTIAAVCWFLPTAGEPDDNAESGEVLRSRRIVGGKVLSPKERRLHKDRYRQRVDELRQAGRLDERSGKNLGEGKDREISELIRQLLPMLENPRTEEQRRAVKMRNLLDSGKRREAVRMARDLMDSDDREVRLACAAVLGWDGVNSLPELTEMLADVDPEVAAAAKEDWDLALQEIPDDADSAKLISDLMPIVREQTEADALLIQLTKMNERLALETISDIIEKNPGTMASECAREMYEHISYGEIYDSPAQTQDVIELIEARQRGELPDQQPKEPSAESEDGLQPGGQDAQSSGGENIPAPAP